MKRNGAFSVLFSLSLMTASHAQTINPIPFDIGFEASEGYSTTFNGNGVINAGGTLGAQAGWSGGGALFVQTGTTFSGAQALEQRSAIAAGSVYGFRWATTIAEGVQVVSAMARYRNGTGTGRTAFALEVWGNQYSTSTGNRYGSVMFTDQGQLALRLRSNTAAPAGEPSFLAANPAIPADTWFNITLAYDSINKRIRGWVDGQPLVDSSNNPLQYTLTDLTTTDLRFPTIAYFNTASGNRLASGIPATDPIHAPTATPPSVADDFAWWDELRYDVYAPRTVRIKVSLQQFDGSGRPLTNIPTVVSFTPTGGGTPVDVTVNLNARGEAIAAAPAEGNFDIKVKPASFLSKTLTNVPVNAFGNFFLNASCKPGDVDANGEVDLTDIDLIIGSYLNSGNNLVEDLDGNGEVDLTDIDIAIGNYLAGDE